MRAFLCCYDYGMGGIWLYIKGESAEAIRQTYPQLTVFESSPAFWTDELEALARKADPETSAFWREWLAMVQNSK